MSTIVARFVLFLLILLASAPYASAEITVRLIEAGESVKIVLDSADADCMSMLPGDLYHNSPGFRMDSSHTFSKQLNSEKEMGKYLVAARLGRGIYIYLPYFHPGEFCGDVIFEVQGEQIMWDGNLYNKKLRIGEREAVHKAIFFTNEIDADISREAYFDKEIPDLILHKMRAKFSAISSYYKDVLAVDAVRSTGVVVAVVHNQGRYFGYGGDALNIIRVTYDNPNPLPVDVAEAFSRTYSHELAHKAQNISIFQNAYGQYLTEGSAEYIGLSVLRELGLIGSDQESKILAKAWRECKKNDSNNTWLERANGGLTAYQEPYDCGLTYYDAAYRSSGLSATDFVELLLAALSGDADYSDNKRQLCLLYESDCQNSALTRLVHGGGESDSKP